MKRLYHPDFVVETQESIYILEPKASNEVMDPKVLAKKQYTLEWIQAVNTNTT
jgi:type III restriction enzyme